MANKMKQFLLDHINQQTNSWADKYVNTENPDDIWFGGLDLGSKHDYARDYMSPEQKAGWSTMNPDQRRELLRATVASASQDDDPSFGQKLVQKGVPLAVAAAGAYALAPTVAGMFGGAGGGAGMAGKLGALSHILPGESGGIPDVMGGGGGGGILGSMMPKDINGWIKLAGGAAGALGILGGNSGAQGGAPGVRGTPTVLPPQPAMNRQQNPMPQADYYTYGKSGGEHRFFADANDGPATPPASGTAPGALPAMPTGYVPNEQLNRMELLQGALHRAGGGSARGPGSGRDDKIEALLSDGEYVIDAESVALLGDGSLDEGAARLDQLRQNLRKHKGAAMAKGKFTPAAKSPEQYIPGMQKGGNVQLDVTELPPRNSNKPAPLPNARGRYASDDGMESVLDELARRSGGQLTAREAEALGLAPKHKAKGGRMRGDWVRAVINGGKDAAQTSEEKLARLQRMLDLEKELKSEKDRDPPPVTPIRGFNPKERRAKGGKIDVSGPRERLAMIRGLIAQHPIKKAEGGPVGELDTLADKLEAALKIGDPVGIDGAMEPVLKLAKGGIVRDDVVNAILEKYRPKTPTSPEDFQRVVDHLRAMKPDSDVLRQYDSSQKDRIYRPSETRRKVP